MGKRRKKKATVATAAHKCPTTRPSKPNNSTSTQPSNSETQRIDDDSQAIDEADANSFIPTPGHLAADFVWQMEALKQTLLISGRATELVELQTQDEFIKFARSVDAVETNTGDGISFSVLPEHRRAGDRIFRQVDIFKRGKETLASNFLIALVAEFDVFFAQLLRWLWSRTPALFGLDQKTVSMSELRGASDVHSVELLLLEREIDELLRNSRSDQFAWLEKRIKVTLGTSDERWSSFVEAHERRHLCVHTGGKVSPQYISACKRLDIPDLPSIGTILNVDPPYIQRSASVFSEVAVMCAQVVWRKIDGCPNEDADNHLTDVTYRLLEDGKYRLASSLLRFALDDIPMASSDRFRKMWKVNLAQAEKWQDNPDESRRIIEEEDWSASGLEFQLAVALLKDDFLVATEVMKQIGNCGQVSKNDYADWPLFQEFRRTPDFLEAYRSIFQEEFKGPRIGNGSISFLIAKQSLSRDGKPK